MTNPHTGRNNPPDLYIFPQNGTITPAPHLTPNQQQQAVKDWHAWPETKPQTTRTVRIIFEHKPGKLRAQTLQLTP